MQRFHNHSTAIQEQKNIPVLPPTMHNPIAHPEQSMNYELYIYLQQNLYKSVKGKNNLILSTSYYTHYSSVLTLLTNIIEKCSMKIYFK